MTFKIKNTRRFLYLFFALVLIPAIITGMAYTEFWVTGEAGIINSLFFLPLSIYYSLPALISSDTYFVTGQGVGPTGIGGIAFSVLLYS